MSRFQFGYPSRLLDLPLRESVVRVGSLDVDGVEFDLRNELSAGSLTATGRRQLSHLLKEQGLALAPAVFPLRRPMSDDVGLEERIAALAAALRFAGELRVPGMILRTGTIPAADSPRRTILCEVVNDLARTGDHVGVPILLATGRESAESLRELLDAVTAGPIALAWDPAAAVMADRKADEIMRGMPADVAQVRLRDGFRESDGAGVETPVGRGEVDWENTLALLAEADYRGWMTPDRTGGDDPAGDAARAIQYVRRVLPF